MAKWRNRRLFQVASAMMLLVLYISTMLAGDVVALTCGCRHHEADVHTSFRHVHKCSSGCCHHHDVVVEHECSESTLPGEAGVVLTERNCCNHDHSTEVKLYVQPRTDDGQVRQTILLAVLMDNSVTISPVENLLSSEYQEFRLPALSLGYGGGLSLRAPPVIA